MPGRFANLEFDNEQHNRQDAEVLGSSMEDLATRYYEQALEASHWGQYEAALRLHTRALGEERACVAAWVGQIQMLVLLGECHEARVWSDKALDIFRNHGDLLAAKAQACVRLKDHKTALACSDNALQVEGESPWRWQVRGEVLLARKERFHDECFQKALVQPAADWFDRVIIARILCYYRRLTAALAYLQEAVQLAPTHGGPWYELGQCQVALGFIAPAHESFQRCLELRTDWDEPRRSLLELDRGVPLRTHLKGLLRGWRRK
ncbi:MAG: hypothetical protein ABIG44_06490 [Planctomycetota bacterium]